MKAYSGDDTAKNYLLVHLKKLWNTVYSNKYCIHHIHKTANNTYPDIFNKNIKIKKFVITGDRFRQKIN